MQGLPTGMRLGYSKRGVVWLECREQKEGHKIRLERWARARSFILHGGDLNCVLVTMGRNWKI